MVVKFVFRKLFTDIQKSEYENELPRRKRTGYLLLRTMLVACH